MTTDHIRLPEKIFTTDGMDAKTGFSSWQEMVSESTYSIYVNNVGKGNIFEARSHRTPLSQLHIFSDTRRSDFPYLICHDKTDDRHHEEHLLLMNLTSGSIPAVRYRNNKEQEIVAGG